MILKRIRASIVLLSLVFIGSFFIVKPVLVYGAEAAVQTNGEIVFSDESTSPTSETSASTPSSEEPIKKPAGKYPSTGELIQKSLSISGIAILVFAVGLYLFKRKQRVERKRGPEQ
jgi:LPXTG-motif cell wall-anchored protein